MTIQLELKPEIAARVETARAQGIDINAVLEKGLPAVSEQSQFLREQAKQQTPRPMPEQLKSALEAIAQAGKDRHYLPAEAFERENLYEDRI